MSDKVNKRKVGKKYEIAAADFLRDKGYVILEMNYQTRYAEIDIVCQDATSLVFVEVKYRKDDSYGNPLEAVNYMKQQRIRLASLFYMKSKGYNPEKTNIRYDAIGIMGDKITHIKNAF